MVQMIALCTVKKGPQNNLSRQLPMKSILSVTFLLLQLQATTFVLAQSECTDNTQAPDICAQAKGIADEIAMQLPLKMSEDMSWESVKAIENTIEGLLRLNHDRILLERLLADSGSDLEQAREEMRRAAQMVCNESSPTRSFINSGGAMRYDYEFVDGEQFLVVEISECP